MDLSKTWVIIPAYNEEKTLGQVINDLRSKGFSHLVVINDGSTDRTAEIAQRQGAKVISHSINCGLGAALSTGLEYLKRNKPKEIEGVITFDADGQHLVIDALKVVMPILEKKADFAVGSRLREPTLRMPLFRQLGNRFLNLLILIFWGIKTSDSQSGLRALSSRALKIIQLKATGYEVSSEFFKEIARHKLSFTEIAISPVYTQHSLNKGQNFSQALHTIRSFLMGR